MGDRDLDQSLSILAGHMPEMRSPSLVDLRFFHHHVTEHISGIAVVDIDGTLDNGKGRMVEQAILALRQFRDLGGKIIVSTSRSFSNSRSVLASLSRPTVEGLAIPFPHPCLYAGLDRGALGVEVKTVADDDDSFEYLEMFRHVVPSWQAVQEFLGQNEHRFPGYEARESKPDPVKMVLKTSDDPSDPDTGVRTKGVFDEVLALRGDYPDIAWDGIRIEATRTAVLFTSIQAGKDKSVSELIRRLREQGVQGPAVGFGDSQDEFASVVPTINVNAEDEHAFDGFSVLGDEIPGLAPGGERTAFYLRYLTITGFFGG